MSTVTLEMVASFSESPKVVPLAGLRRVPPVGKKRRHSKAVKNLLEKLSAEKINSLLQHCEPPQAWYDEADGN